MILQCKKGIFGGQASALDIWLTTKRAKPLFQLNEYIGIHLMQVSGLITTKETPNYFICKRLEASFVKNEKLPLALFPRAICKRSFNGLGCGSSNF